MIVPEARRGRVARSPRGPGRSAQRDARDGVISLRVAREVYGVVLDSQSFTIDEQESEKLRQELAIKRGAKEVATPTVPSASTWLQEHMREGDEFLLDPQ